MYLGARVYGDTWTDRVCKELGWDYGRNRCCYAEYNGMHHECDLMSVVKGDCGGLLGLWQAYQQEKISTITEREIRDEIILL